MVVRHAIEVLGMNTRCQLFSEGDVETLLTEFVQGVESSPYSNKKSPLTNKLRESPCISSVNRSRQLFPQVRRVMQQKSTNDCEDEEAPDLSLAFWIISRRPNLGEEIEDQIVGP